jgi:small subunit ribosomal protein S14
MAKIGSIEKNNRRIKLVKSMAPKRAKLKEQIYNKTTSLEERFRLVMLLASLPRNGAKTRVRNRCFLTGRPRAYSRKFGLSRNMFRDLAALGQVPGLVKASW